ncbi:hypothetical protein [Krasilnikovia sp. MM14-A1259]|uniref:hypothetical protein n=1 Tax=Krasilnikovia sp. MM14-A1259 TaxID=3373539 RepID=UPI0038279109
MSQVQVFPLIDGFIGYGDGASIKVETGTPLDADHPVVVERPELFTKPPTEEPKRGGRSRTSNG